jgi:hypothetical protein
MTYRKQFTAVLAGVAMTVAACGGGDSEATTTIDEATTTTEATPSTTEAPATTTTAAATSSTAGEEGIVPGEDPDVDAIVEVYRVVFDSTTSFEEKAALIDDATGLEDTVATYAATGESVGGATVEPTAVVVNGDEAEVVYTIFFSGNPTYPGQPGSATRVNGEWKVSRDMFCGLMASARSACPAG